MRPLASVSTHCTRIRSVCSAPIRLLPRRRGAAGRCSHAPSPSGIPTSSDGGGALRDVLGYAGRRVVVTGAASGMGEATARLLVELGAEVHALDVKPVKVGVAQALGTNLAEDRKSTR